MYEAFQRGIRPVDAALKVLSPDYPPLQVTALRGLSSLPLITVWVMFDGGLRQLLRVRWPLHILRGLLSIVMLSSFAYALRTLPLAETYSLFFIAPLIITALAALILHERVDWRCWTAIVIGFCGTLIVLRPSGAGVLTLAGVAVLVSATATRSRRSPCACSGAATRTRAWCSGC